VNLQSGAPEARVFIISYEFQSKKLRPRDSRDEESFKVRKGKVGGYVDYLDPADRAFVDRVIRELDDPYWPASQERGSARSVRPSLTRPIDPPFAR